MEIKARNGLSMCFDCMQWWFKKDADSCRFWYICHRFHDENELPSSVVTCVVSGLGFELTHEMKSKFFYEYDEDDFKSIGLNYRETGEYDCPSTEWILIPIKTGDTVKEIEYNAFMMLEILNKLGIVLKKTDLIFVSDVYEY